MRKRGLSNIVSTVLIMLLVFAAIAIVWAFLRPSLEEAGTNIELQRQCLDVEVKPTRCTTVTEAVATVTIKNERGEAIEVMGIVIFDDESTQVNRANAPPLGGTRSVGIEIPVGRTAEEAKAAAIVQSDHNRTYVCPESVISIICTSA